MGVFWVRGIKGIRTPRCPSLSYPHLRCTSAMRSAPILKLAAAFFSTSGTVAPAPAPTASSPLATPAPMLVSLAAAAAAAGAAAGAAPAPAPAAAPEEAAPTTLLPLLPSPALDIESWLLLHPAPPRRHENGLIDGDNLAPPCSIPVSSLAATPPPAASACAEDWRTVRWCPPPRCPPPVTPSSPPPPPPPPLRQRLGRSSRREPTAPRNGDEEALRRPPPCPPPSPASLLPLPLPPRPAAPSGADEDMQENDAVRATVRRLPVGLTAGRRNAREDEEAEEPAAKPPV